MALRLVGSAALVLGLVARAHPALAQVDVTRPPPARQLELESTRAWPAPVGDTSTAQIPEGLAPTPSVWIQSALVREAARFASTHSRADGALAGRQQPSGRPLRRSWVGRHPVLVGVAVGFVGGYLIGYLPGDDGVFYDFTAAFNGAVMGGIGAGTGAAVGALVGATRKQP